MKPEKLAELLSALDNPIKLKIVDLIAREGSKSLSDIRNELKISFSTAFKYLNQMEKAGILRCRKIRDGRKKNIYTLEKFKLDISPEGISQVFSRKERGRKKKLLAIDWEGKLQEFDIDVIERIAIEAGTPKDLIEKIRRVLAKRVYNGITFAEIRKILFEILEEENRKIYRLREALQSTEFLFRKKNFLDVLREKNLGEIVRAHLEKDIHIRNVGKSYPIDLQHNFSLILKHGLKIIGLKAEPPKNMTSCVSHFETAIKAINENLADLQQTFDFFNIFLAPYIRKKNKYEVKQMAERIIYSLDHLYTITNAKSLRVYINLEVSIPKFLKNQPAYCGGKEVGSYKDYEAEARTLLEMFLSVLSEKGKTICPKFILKFRNRKDIPENIKKVFDQIYVANLIPKWQTENANYMFDWTRLDSNWKSWERTIGTVEMQMVALNLPRLGYITKDEDKIYELLLERLNLIKKCIVASVESINSKALTELNYLNHRVGRDKYCHFDDGISIVEVCGVKDLIETIAGDYVENKKLALKILKFIDKNIKLKNLRVGLAEFDYSLLSQGFAKYDKMKFNSKRDFYTGGVDINLPDIEKIEFLGDFHKILKGGHMCQLKKLNMEILDKILKSNIGLAAGKGIDKL